MGRQNLNTSTTSVSEPEAEKNTPFFENFPYKNDRVPLLGSKKRKMPDARSHVWGRVLGKNTFPYISGER